MSLLSKIEITIVFNGLEANHSNTQKQNGDFFQISPSYSYCHCRQFAL